MAQRTAQTFESTDFRVGKPSPELRLAKIDRVRRYMAHLDFEVLIYYL